MKKQNLNEGGGSPNKHLEQGLPNLRKVIFAI